MTETAANGRGRAWRDALAVYFRPRVALMFMFGFSAGLPYHLTGSTLQAWLTESKVSVEEIGLFALVAAAYAWKFVWAPAIDGIPIPYFSRWLGHRRSWLLLTTKHDNVCATARMNDCSSLDRVAARILMK